MPRGPAAVPIELTEAERDALERWTRRRLSAAGLAQRSRIVLACAEGETNTAVAAKVGASVPTVRRWRGRFAERGLDGLLDEQRPGRPRKIGDDQVEDVIVRTLESRPPDGGTHWSTRQMAASTGLSQTAISRIWRAFGLQPHRFEHFKLSRDPLFVDKVRDIVGLYLDPPERALVLCVDEKSQIQALDRSAPTLPILAGTPARATHDYKRHGSSSLFAALDTESGEVIRSLHARHRAIEFKKFLVKIDSQVPAELEVHLILDNYATHKTAKIKRWLAAHPRFVLHFTPTGRAGSTWSSAGSRSSPPASYAAGCTARWPSSTPTSRPGSSAGTRTQSHTSGPRPPTRSSPTSRDTATQLTVQDTSVNVPYGADWFRYWLRRLAESRGA